MNGDRDLPISWFILGEAVAWGLYLLLRGIFKFKDPATQMLVGGSAAIIAIVVVMLVHRRAK